MRIGSLFAGIAGIGGFDLAAESLGWSTAWVSEIDPFATATLAVRFPQSPNLGDFTVTDWSTVERPDIICAGWPCQPHSVAGKRGGSDDDRDLWPAVARCLRELRPRYFVGENVPGLLTSDGGGMFNRVLSDLADLGYDAEWSVLSACAVGAPHTRERLFIVAYASGIGLQGQRASWQPEPQTHEREVLPVRRGEGRIATAWDAEPNVGRVVTGLPNRAHRIRALGNAVIPACVIEGPFRRILELEGEL